MSDFIPAMLTVGEISRRLGQPLHKIEYVIRSRQILPSARAGNARVFSEPHVGLIARELKRIESEKGGHHE